LEAFRETVRKRRGIRSFSDEPVPYELTENAIGAASTARSSWPGDERQPLGRRPWWSHPTSGFDPPVISRTSSKKPCLTGMLIRQLIGTFGEPST
jgi:hypothetical protein